MPVLTSDQVARLLPKHGFDLKNGDARRVAEAAKDASLASLISAALGLGISQRARSSENPGWPAGPARSNPQRDGAVNWISKLVAQILDHEDVCHKIVDAILSEAIEGTVIDTDCPGDLDLDDGALRDADGLVAIRSDVKYDLSTFRTLGDVMDEWTAREAPLVRRLGESLKADFETMVRYAVAKAAEVAATNATPDVMAYLASLDEAALALLLKTDCYDAMEDHLADAFWLEEIVRDMPFREALVSRRPDALERLENDEAAEASEVQFADKAALEIKAAFAKGNMKADDFYEVANAVASGIRSKQDIDLARRLFRHKDIASIVPKAAKSRFQAMAAKWLEEIETNELDFETPLVRLVIALDETWRKDGRPFQVIVTHDDKESLEFSVDTWAFLFSYALTGGNEELARNFGVAVRRIEGGEGPRQKDTIAGIFIDEDGFKLLKADEMRKVYAQDKVALKNATLVDAETLLPDIGKALAGPPVDRSPEVVSFAAMAAEEVDEKLVATIFPDGIDSLVVLNNAGGFEVDRRFFALKDGFEPGMVKKGLLTVVAVEHGAPIKAATTWTTSQAAAPQKAAPPKSSGAFKPVVHQGGIKD